MEKRMRNRIWIMLLPGMVSWLPLHAQSAPNAAEVNGKRMFQQRCSICHAAAVPGSKSYGPALNQELVAGHEDVIKNFIMKGTQRMPAFQYGLEPKEIDDIVAYLKTVKKAEPKKQPEGNQPAA